VETSLAQPVHSHKADYAGASVRARAGVIPALCASETGLATRYSRTSEDARAYIDLQTGVN